MMHHGWVGHPKPTLFFLFAIILWILISYKTKPILGQMCSYSLEAQSFILSHCKTSFHSMGQSGEGRSCSAIRPQKGTSCRGMRIALRNPVLNGLGQGCVCGVHAALWLDEQLGLRSLSVGIWKILPPHPLFTEVSSKCQFFPLGGLRWPTSLCTTHSKVKRNVFICVIQ